MSGLEIAFVALGVGAGLAVFCLCAVMAWRLLKGPRS